MEPKEPLYDTALLLFGQSVNYKKLWLHLKTKSCGKWVKNAGKYVLSRRHGYAVSPLMDTVMAISVISVSSDSSEESVGISAGRVILFGTIPDTTPTISPPTTHTDTTVTPTEIPTVLPTVPPSPDHTPALPDITLASPDYLLAFDTEYDPSKDPSLDHIPPLPAILPFLSLTDDTTDSDTPHTPPSPTHAPGQPIRYRRPYRYHPNEPLHMLTAKKRVRPLPTHRLAMRHFVDHSSSDYFSPDDSARDSSSDSSLEALSDFHSDALSDSSSIHSLPDHSSPDLLSTSAGPSRKRRRSPMTSIPALSPVSRALSPVCADLIPSPKRVRDSDYLADVEVDSRESSELSRFRGNDVGVDDDIERVDESHSEHEIDPMQATIEACFYFVDIIKSREIDVRVVAETIARDEIGMDTRDIVEGGDDRCNTPKMGRSGIRIRGMLLQDQQHKI
ncbi:hypothetical protein Tco_1323387, partial [Tanacetum coccineum]